MASFGIKRTLDIGFDEALGKVPEALQTEGFGILTEIDSARSTDCSGRLRCRDHPAKRPRRI